MLYGVGDIIIGDKAVCSGSVSFEARAAAFTANSFNDFGIKTVSGARINDKQYFVSFELGADAWCDFQAAWGMTQSAETITSRQSETFRLDETQEFTPSSTLELQVYSETRHETFTNFIDNNGTLVFPVETIGEIFTVYYNIDLNVSALVGAEDKYVKLSAKLYSSTNSAGYYLVADKATREKVSPLSFTSNSNNGLYNVTFRLVTGRAERKPFKLYELQPPEVVEPSELIGLCTQNDIVLLTQDGRIIEAQLESLPLETNDNQPIETQAGDIIRI